MPVKYSRLCSPNNISALSNIAHIPQIHPRAHITLKLLASGASDHILSKSTALRLSEAAATHNSGIFVTNRIINGNSCRKDDIVYPGVYYLEKTWRTWNVQGISFLTLKLREFS